jgi:molybdate transport system substrate-binding protein
VRLWKTLGLLGLVPLALAPACGDDAAHESSLTVLAAASLTDAFTELGDAFEAGHEGVSLSFSFGASSSLREQILAGVPADVFASANTSNMDQVVEAGAASDPEVFVRNRLVIATPKGNPAGVSGLADFADDGLLLGLCAAQVPCGRFAREALAKAGVEPALDTEAEDVRALLTQLQSGDLDAGIVYVTDVDDDVDAVDLPDDHNIVADYPIATLTEAGNAALAREFVAFVLSEAGQAILEAHGFGPA